MAVHDLSEQIRRERAAERYPPLFKRLPDRLFTPLASANRFQYWSLLCVLHAKRFGPEAPLPPSAGFLMREITADIAEELQYQDWTPEGEEETPATPLQIRAIAVFNRLRDAGWLRVDRVGVREMVTMAPAVAHFMNRLIEFANTGPEYVIGKIRSIEANLRLLLDESTDGGSLHEAARQSRALLEHVRVAGMNVRDLMLEIGRVDTTGEFVRRFFDDYVERMFIGDYKELRTSEHPIARRQEILRLAAHVQQTSSLRAKMIGWYLDKQAGRDPTRAEALFERDIQKVEDLRRIDEYLDRLDDEIRRANKLALAYLDYRLRATRPLDELIGQAIAAVLKHGSAAAALMPVGPGDCVAGERLASPRTESKRPAASALRNQVMSAEQEAQARLALQARDRRTVSLPKLAAFVRQQLGDASAVPSTSLQVDSIEAVRALQALCTIAAANATSSKLLHANARSMSSGFTTVRIEGDEDRSKGISHLPFLVARTTKTKTGGR